MELVKAEGELVGQYAEEIPALAWSTGPSSYQYHFGRRALFDALVLRSWATPSTLFSADATTLALENGQLLGIAITMLGPEFRERSAALGPLWPEMIGAGEESGRLGEVMEEVSHFYAKALRDAVKAATSMIEPIMIVAMGSIVGFIAMAIILPIFKMSSLVG